MNVLEKDDGVGWGCVEQARMAVGTIAILSSNSRNTGVSLQVLWSAPQMHYSLTASWDITPAMMASHTHTNDKGRANFRHQFQFRLSLFIGKWSSIYCTMPFDLVRPRTITERWQPARERDVTQLQHCNVYLPFHSKSHAFIAENGLSTSAWQGWGT